MPERVNNYFHFLIDSGGRKWIIARMARKFQIEIEPHLLKELQEIARQCGVQTSIKHVANLAIMIGLNGVRERFGLKVK